MLIDTATLQKHLDAITEQIKEMNRLSSGFPQSNWHSLMTAQVELRRLHETLGRAVFKMYIEDEHKAAIADIEARLQLPGRLTQKSGNESRECEVCHKYIAHNIVNDKFCCDKCFNTGAAYRD